MKNPILGSGVYVDIARLIETRLLVQANSGGGKSYALRKLCEVAYGGAQIIILDVEGEFHSLREKFDYVLAGQKGGDCPADCKSAALLARRLLELGTSAIIDIYELGAQRARFVRLFLESLMSAPRELWHPVIVVVDEAHMFCPEQDKAESASAVIDLMTRGRKRGFCGVLATQRISKLSKDAAAECNNVLVGRCTLDIDVKRASAALGLTRSEHSSVLQGLQEGEFYASGPALVDSRGKVYPSVKLTKVGEVETTHPKAGQRAMAPTPPRAAVKKILGQLANLPAEAEEEAKSIGELRTRVRELEAAARKAPKVEAVKVDPKVLAKVDKVADKLIKMAEAFRTTSGALSGDLLNEIQSLKSTLSNKRRLTDEFIDETFRKAPAIIKEVERSAAPSVAPSLLGRPRLTGLLNGSAREPPRSVAAEAAAHDIDGPMRKLLGALAWFEAIGVTAPDNRAMAFVAGYRGMNGSVTNARSRLKAAELVEYGTNTTSMTTKGRAAAPHVETPRDGSELRRMVIDLLDGPEQRLLNPLIEHYPEPIATEELARLANYSGVNGSVTNARSRLNTLGLVEYNGPGMTRAAPILFP